MTKIRLTRVVKPVLVITEGDCRIDQKAKTVAVTFEGRDGKTVSLAFDGRCDRDSAGGSMVRETYVPYADCPVMTFLGENGPATDGAALRALRDALNEMDLGYARFRTREYGRNGSVGHVTSDDYDALTKRIDEGVEAGCLTGGGIDEYVEGRGWVVCDD
jgi:hypothetical protein